MRRWQARETVDYNQPDILGSKRPVPKLLADLSQLEVAGVRVVGIESTAEN